MLYNKPGEINEMRLTFDDDKLRFYWREKEYENTIDVGMNGEYGVSTITLGDLTYHTYSKAAWQEDGGLKLWIRPIETAHVRKFTLYFKDNDVKIVNEMTPRIEDLIIYYMTFTGHPIKEEITEDVLKGAVKSLGLPIIEPDFKGEFVE